MDKKELLERCIKTFLETFCASLIGLGSTNITLFSLEDLEVYIFSFLLSAISSVLSLLANTILKGVSKK